MLLKMLLLKRLLLKRLLLKRLLLKRLLLKRLLLKRLLLKRQKRKTNWRLKKAEMQRILRACLQPMCAHLSMMQMAIVTLREYVLARLPVLMG
jgi:hypothetical protein